jgi:uncharacterized protein YbaP (TraB family)
MRPCFVNRLAAAAAMLLALAACAAPRELRPSASRASTPKAFLWEVTRPDAPDRPLYLTGSIHAGRPEQFKFPPAFERAIARAEALVVEVDPSKVELAEIQQLSLQLGLYRPPETSLSAHLDEKTRALLPSALERIGLTPEAVEGLRPWMLAVTVSVIELQRAGYDAKAGIDALLLARFSAPKEVVELETAAAQVRLLAGLPERIQVLMLQDALHSGATAAISLAQIAAAWEGGNPDALASTMFARASDPELAPMYQAVFYDRNRAMTDKLAALAGAPKVHLAVVGAGHLVGEHGILAVLAARGLRVRQLERE